MLKTRLAHDDGDERTSLSLNKRTLALLGIVAAADKRDKNKEVEFLVEKRAVELNLKRAGDSAK